MSRHASASAFHKSKTLNDKYLLGDEIGKGAYGRVYKGLDLENGDFVAIKQVSLENIPSEDLASIMSEIDLLKNLNHKNIVKYQGSFKTKTHLYIILEYVENGSLASIIKPSKFGAFPESLVAVYIAQVLEGLVYLHEQGVIHRDIKGANILTTKEGLVKLADFGVATKLTEADINTHSVVGTPYWMAPEVIEMSGVSAASDIWSVGCTVIELLTCIPPYYDLQPMPALFRIVQDERPPLPEHVSGVITDFLLQCFRKDAKLRPDAKTLLNHPWIRNSRRQLQSSLERNARISNIPEDVSLVLERTIQEGSKQNPPAGQEEGLMRDPFESGSDDDAKGNSPTTSYEASAASSSQSHSNGHRAPIRIPRQGVSHFQRLSGSHQLEATGTNSSGQNRVTSLAIGGHVLAQVESPDSVSSRPETGIALDLAAGPGAAEDQLRHETSGRWSDHGGGLSSGKSQIGISHGGDDGEVKDLMMGEKKHNLVSRTEVNGSLFPQGAKTSSGAADKVSRFKEPPSDALMDDLFESSHVRPQDASTSAPSDHGLPPRGGPVPDTASAGKLKSKVPQKKISNADGSKRSSVDLFTALIDVDEKEIDISELGFENRAEGRDYFAKQASEVNRLMGLLKPEEQDEVVISACQKLVLILREFPNRKSHLISHHGLIPLMDMLETNSNKVLHEIMRVINQVIQDNQDLQENACLVGLVPAITSFAGQERSREIRMQAAYFVQQLCHTSPLTLQMFIACRGLPVLVGFLEPDYAKFREMVHMAVDGMWQVFELHSSSPKNDFCRIFAKSGVLVRLVNTLHNLNEAMRAGAVIAVSSTSTTTGDKPAHKSTGSFEGLSVKARSGPLDHVKGGHIEAFRPYSGQLEPSKVARSTHGENYRSSAGMEAARLQPGHAHKSTGLPDYSRHFPGQAGQQGRPHSGQLDPARVAHSSEHVRQPTAVDLFLQYGESTNWQPDAGRVERDEEVRSDGDSTRPLLSADESWALLEAVPQTGHAPVDLPLQASFLNLLDKEKPSRPITGQQLDNVRHPSDRSESTLPLLHHSGVLRRSGDFDSGFPASTDGEKETGLVEMVSLPLAKLGWNGRLSPSPSGRLNIQGSWPLANVGEPYSNGSGLASQTASGVLTASGHPNTRLGSTTSSGVLTRMQSALNPEEAREYITKVSNLLFEFSRGDSVVKMHMCSLSLLIRLFQMLNKLETPILLKILKCINQLSTEPNTLEPLQRADAMKHLVPFLEQREGPYVADIQNEVLSALHNLCKINKRRQEQAAESGIIPHLMHFIVTNSPLKQYALPLLCDMAHASRYTREQLRVYKGLDVYLSLLDDQMWAVTALDSLAVCLAHDNDQRKVESALLKKEALMKLVGFFQSCGGNSFVHILEPFLKMINKSVRLNTALAVSGLTPLLVGRLDHQDAIARLNLLKMIKAVYEHHPRPKQLIVEHDLPSKLQKLIEERRDGERSGGQVLVKQMATALLKALHINTVL